MNPEIKKEYEELSDKMIETFDKGEAEDTLLLLTSFKDADSLQFTARGSGEGMGTMLLSAAQNDKDFRMILVTVAIQIVKDERHEKE